MVFKNFHITVGPDRFDDLAQRDQNIYTFCNIRRPHNADFIAVTVDIFSLLFFEISRADDKIYVLFGYCIDIFINSVRMREIYYYFRVCRSYGYAEAGYMINFGSSGF